MIYERMEILCERTLYFYFYFFFPFVDASFTEFTDFAKFNEHFVSISDEASGAMFTNIRIFDPADKSVLSKRVNLLDLNPADAFGS